MSTAVQALQLCFGLEDSMQSHATVFHNAHQKEGESLADFSRLLLRLHSRMVAAAKTEEDGKALKQLRDRALRDQFCRGAREAWVRRELRRFDLATKGTFDDVRKEAVFLFNDPETAGRRITIREVGEDVAQVSVDHAALYKENSNDVLAKELAETRKELQSLKNIATEVQDLKRLVKELVEKRNRPRAADLYFCRRPGHYQSQCLNRRGACQQASGKLDFSAVEGATVEISSR
ncbi:hypothetical protein BSL78_12214 [Apostichopus japonicus]|uniref:Uncharacterized protein n=1 Tax=Stichopus japonicus TaxID=307972 RepID=A0A2G8KSD6_STIJA|nr:hypothetical protein BSL78_12214 [Apostichopus japonicus]